MIKEVFVKIYGRVQGIGYRRWAVSRAEEIGGISGWVHNETDGTVEIMMRGEEENRQDDTRLPKRADVFARRQTGVCCGTVERLSAPDRRRGFQTLLNRGGLCTP